MSTNWLTALRCTEKTEWWRRPMDSSPPPRARSLYLRAVPFNRVHPLPPSRQTLTLESQEYYHGCTENMTSLIVFEESNNMITIKCLVDLSGRNSSLLQESPTRCSSIPPHRQRFQSWIIRIPGRRFHVSHFDWTKLPGLKSEADAEFPQTFVLSGRRWATPLVLKSDCM